MSEFHKRRAALWAEFPQDAEYYESEFQDLSGRLAEAIECCTIKDNRNLRLEIELANASGMLVEAWTLMVDGKVADDFGDRLQQWIDSRQTTERRVTTRATDPQSVGS